MHAQYHDKGFEIVGVSLDGAGFDEKLRQFLQRNDMSWPQHYHDRRWETPLAVKYSVMALPTMLLLDKTGRIVSTEARGNTLEDLVRKYLEL